MGHPNTGQDLLTRLEDKFVVGDGCWPWTACRSSDGYGHIRIEGSVYKAHRVVYELMVGPIPVGLEIDHLCRNRACVRPDHLEPVTKTTNVRRGLAMVNGAQNAAKTHCPAGHPYDAENTRVGRTRMGIAYRVCRTCDRERVRRKRDHP